MDILQVANLLIKQAAQIVMLINRVRQLEANQRQLQINQAALTEALRALNTKLRETEELQHITLAKSMAVLDELREIKANTETARGYTTH